MSNIDKSQNQWSRIETKVCFLKKVGKVDKSQVKLKKKE